MPLSTKSLFIVEDNAYNRVTYQIALIRTGAFVEFEQWVAGAMRKLMGGRKYDLIILDLMLSRGESGYTLFKEIRSLPKFKNTLIIAVSAAEGVEAMAQCRELGFDGYIAKPINPELFPLQLERILAGESIWLS